jgi:formimidoylglutamate deiminase
VNAAEVIEAELTWTGKRFESGISVAIGEDGRIMRVGKLKREPTRLLEGRALIPGLVNGHSHAFQRGLRGKGERFGSGAGSFWSWREAMYGLVEQLGPEDFLAVTTQAFTEMRAAGITTVGEFHYFHHGPASKDFGYDRLVLKAARAAQIRLVLLATYYRTGGVGRPLGPGQRRFETPSPQRFWANMDALAEHLGPGQTLGGVVHSIRAADLDELAAVHAETMRRGLPFHIHVEEQRREITECMKAYGRPPMRVLLDTIGQAEHVTAVHCTHTDPDDRAAFIELGGRICVCPLTEANLGDGLPSLDGLPYDRVSLGTDSNARIDLVEEMRWLEYGQRLRREERGAVRDGEGHVARTLLTMATAGGADSLGVEAGRIAPGLWADFALLDLNSMALAGATQDTLLDAFVFGADAGVVTDTCVGGKWFTSR